MSISPKELTAKLLGKTIVKVKSSCGEEIMFEIQKVNIESFAGEGAVKLGNIAGKTQDEVKKMFINKFEGQEISKLISPVILDGVASPKIVTKEDCDIEKEVPLSVLLRDLELASNLYIEILKISMDKKDI